MSFIFTYTWIVFRLHGTEMPIKFHGGSKKKKKKKNTGFGKPER